MIQAKVKFHKNGWRDGWADFLSLTCSKLVLVCPYIRRSEVNFVLNNIRRETNLCTMTSIREDSIRSGALEMDALAALSERAFDDTVINLPNLHAKIMIADNNRAIVTSANLTSSGIDKNYEYGVEFAGKHVVNRICADVQNYRDIGVPVSAEKIREISALADNINRIERKKPAEKDLTQAIESLKHECAIAQIGKKTATTLFADAVLYALQHKAMTTKNLHNFIQRLYPTLCEDDRERIIGGISYGKLWKHHLRNAQQQLKRQNKVFYDKKTRLWTAILSQAR